MSEKQKELKEEELTQVTGGDFIVDKYYILLFADSADGRFGASGRYGPFDTEAEALVAGKQNAIESYEGGWDIIKYIVQRYEHSGWLDYSEHYYPE